MGVRFRSMILGAKQILRLQSLARRNQPDVPKGHFAVYVGEIQKKRFVIPVSYLNHSSFQELLARSEEEFGFDHPMGGLTISCKEDTSINLSFELNGS